MKKIFITLIIIIVVAFVVGLISRQNKQTKKNNLAVVKIGYAPYVSPYFVAIEKGYFEKEGIKAELISMPSSINSMQAMAKGEVDVLSVPYSVLFQFENTFPGSFKIFGGVIEPKDKPYSYLIVKNNINSVDELRGKKIVTRSGSNAKMQAELVLKGLNIDSKDIELVQVESPLTAATFAKSDISADIDSEPSATSILKKVGGKILVAAVRPKYLTDPYPSTGFIFSSKFVAKNKIVADKFVKANDKAIDYLNKHDSEFRTIMEKFLKLDHDIASSMSTIVFEKLSQLNKTAIKNEMLLEYKNKILKKKVDLTNVYYTL